WAGYASLAYALRCAQPRSVVRSPYASRHRCQRPAGVHLRLRLGCRSRRHGRCHRRIRAVDRARRRCPLSIIVAGGGYCRRHGQPERRGDWRAADRACRATGTGLLAHLFGNYLFHDYGGGACVPALWFIWAAGMTAVLKVDSIGGTVGSLRAVRDVTLQAHAGERLIILGTNGAGKSTLFNLIAGDILPTYGSIAWRGQAIQTLSAHERTR